jgi:hypothetical protein
MGYFLKYIGGQLDMRGLFPQAFNIKHAFVNINWRAVGRY